MKRKNFLDYIPVISPDNSWNIIDNKVIIIMHHKGFYNRLSQKLFHTPKVSKIDLDEYGSFVWRLIDGNRSVGEIADLLSSKYGGEVEPLYSRIVKYMQILYNNKFIIYNAK